MKKYIVASISLILILSVYILNYKKEKKLNINNNDVTFAYYIDGVASNTAPENNSNYIFDDVNSSCSNGANIRWNYEEWSAVITNIPTTKTKCHLKFKKEYNESILNGTYPVLEDPLIPITIEDDGTVKKADLSKEWYSYTNKKWANAIILKDESTKNNYKTNDVIAEDSIESYFVWIPRYRYKIFNDGNYASVTTVENKVQEIEIVFENKDTTLSTGSTAGSWLTHPAFVSFNTNGMWVGKFETGNKGTETNVRNADQIQIKPNVSSWRNIQVSNAFYTTYDYNRNLESHMMKNTEWGAIAYLQHSIYGSQESVRINNNSSYLTGYAAIKEPTCGYVNSDGCHIVGSEPNDTLPYNTSIGYLASTTKNITGIYDIAGGSWEYVMGIMLDENGNLVSGSNNTVNSGFNGVLSCPACDNGDGSITSITNSYNWPNKKYYDTYSYSTIDANYHRRILGDATGEMGPFGQINYTASGKIQSRSASSWYDDYAFFINNRYPWFVRGSLYTDGKSTGMFAFNNVNGRAYQTVGFRIVLSPGGTL